MDPAHTMRLMIVLIGMVLTRPDYVLGLDQSNQFNQSITSCPLLPTMEISKCDVGGAEVQNKDSVPEGTVCMLDAEDREVLMLECVQKTWKEKGEHKVTGLGMSRTKRLAGVNISWTISSVINSCVFICDGKLANKPPSIRCPKIPSTLYADKAESSKRVTWSQPVAQDKENGALSTHVTSGWGPGSVLTDGSYYVTYITKDQGGKTDTCTKYFSVKARRCSSDGTFMENGQATCSAYTLYGSRCSYACNSGYELSGPSSSECQRNYVWKDSKPICKEVSCGSPPAVSRGKLLCTGHTYTATCGVTCTDIGYSLQGSSIITCQQNKTWTQPGLCVDVKPPTLNCSETLIAHTRPHLTHNVVNWKLPAASDNSGQFVSVTSEPKPGSNFTLGTHKVVFTGTDTSGLKSFCYMTVIMKELRCDASEGIPDFATVTCSHRNAVGSVCNVACYYGYDLEGDAQRTCQEDGKWSGKPAVCKLKQCPKPPVVAYGHYDCPDGQEFQDVCSLICEFGFKTADPFVITCQINGNWTSAGSCTDDEPPVFPYGCPADIKTHAGALKLSASVTYEYPLVTDNSGGNVTITAKPELGSEISVGATEITITAFDSQGHADICTFNIIVEEVSCEKPNFDSTGNPMVYDCPDNYVYGASCSLTCSDSKPVQGSSLITCDKIGAQSKLSWTWSDLAPYCESEVCPKLRTPKHGSVTCTNIFGGKDQQCIVECDDQYMYPQTAPDMFMCFHSTGEWSPEGLVADCNERRKPKALKAEFSFHYLASSCDDLDIEIKKKLSTLINKVLKGVCTGNQKCNISEMDVSCSSSHRKRRIVDKNKIKREILVQVDLGDYEDKGSPSESLEHYNVLVEHINDALVLNADKDIFNITEIGEFHSLDYADPVFTCDPGEILAHSTMSCSGCGKGQMLDNSTNSCIPCPVGTYQSNESSTSCTQCPEGTSTANTESDSEDQCFLLCGPGETSSTGLEPCSPCQKGSYQENRGMTECDLCPFGMSTLLEGSSSSSECHFYNVLMHKDISHAIIQLSDPNPTNFTLLMWVHPVSSIMKQGLDFSLDSSQNKTGSAFFSLGNFKLFVTPTELGYFATVRKWYHVALVYMNETAILYVDGKEVMRTQTLQMAEFTKREFRFSQSDLLKSIIISGVQMTSSGLERNEVQEFSTSCNRQVEDNVLEVDHIDTRLVTPSTCDDVNNCADNPCGEFGTCIDKRAGFTCICDEPWSGDRCQVVPDFCLNHGCAEGSTCVNSPRNKTYICACPSGYAGRLCYDQIVNGNWDLWEEWGPCSVTCGSGQRSRMRECNNPKPNLVGEYCHGNGTESHNCEERPCPVDGQWTEWSLWTYSATCGNVTAFRQRTCNSPAPGHGGNPCLGPKTEFKISEDKLCPVDGMFGLWSEWTQCSATCGGGSSSRSRACDSPPAAHGGAQCNSSQAVETKLCNVHKCPKCKALNSSEIGKSSNCTYYEATDMKVCNLTCKPGMVLVPNDLNEFKCGSLTNYTWSHQTKKNPTGILPKCTDVKIPSSQKTLLNVQFDNINCSRAPPMLEFENSIKNNLEQTINCKDIADCSSHIETTHSCGKQKQSKGSLFAVVILGISQAGKNSKYLSTLSESEIAVQMNHLRMIENMTLQLMNQSSDIYDVNIKGVIYTGEIKSATAEVECPQDGSGFVEGVCADCPRGTYSDGKGSCVQCSKGLYQDQPRMKSCVKCPEGLTTSGVGFSSKSDCKADPPDYLDYFDWMYDDIHDNENSDDGKLSSEDTLIIGVTAVMTLFLVMLVTYATICIIRRVKAKEKTVHINRGSMQIVYANEMYQKNRKLESDLQEERETNIYYEIGPELNKEMKMNL